MLQAFLVSLREALQCSLLIAFFLGCPSVSGRMRWALAGVAAAFLVGMPMSYIPAIAGSLPAHESWVLLRHISELSLFFLGAVFLMLKAEIREGPSGSSHLVSSGMFLLGFIMYFFEARSLGFLVHDIGLMNEAVFVSFAVALLASLIGFAPLVFLLGRIRRLRLERFLTLPSLFIALGTLKFAFGGIGETEEGNILVSMQRGVHDFLVNAVGGMREVLMVTGHSFIEAPLSGVWGLLSNDRVALSLVVLFVVIPPVLLLVKLFSRPDPDLDDLDVPAERRLRLAFFRKELLYRSMPALLSVLVILVSLHAANVSLNPMSEPDPIPVRESDGHEGEIWIPLSDKMGDFTDGKLRKYLYYYGGKQVIFLAILKTDGTVGVALDECEICKPAEWNKSAKGYAQRGDTLVCKYCMTPIAVDTVNKPGGCNPIPVPFRVEEEHVVVSLKDLLHVFKEAKALDKKGTHL